MAQLASKLVRVKDLAASVDFYQKIMNFSVEHYNDGKQYALFASAAGELLLAAGPEAEEEEIRSLLTPVFDQPKPGQYHYFRGGAGLRSYRDQLLAAQREATWIETEWGWEKLQMVDPDGYVLSFWGGRRLSDEEILHFYDLAPSRLKLALEGLNEQDLNLTRAPGKWSIRQTVLHMVDSDATSLAMVKFAMAEPGRSFAGNSYDPDVWAEGLDYAGRLIDAEVELFTAIRRHIGGLLRHIDGALDRSVTLSTGQTASVRQRIEPLMGHALHHIEQIWETRKVHGK